MNHQQARAIKLTVRRITRLPLRIKRNYAILGAAGHRAKEPRAHAILDALKADGLHILCEPQARKLADANLFEYVGLQLSTTGAIHHVSRNQSEIHS